MPQNLLWNASLQRRDERVNRRILLFLIAALIMALFTSAAAYAQLAPPQACEKIEDVATGKAEFKVCVAVNK
jgi:hypothetical protein